jgi:hypothetical protein
VPIILPISHPRALRFIQFGPHIGALANPVRLRTRHHPLSGRRGQILRGLLACLGWDFRCGRSVVGSLPWCVGVLFQRVDCDVIFGQIGLIVQALEVPFAGVFLGFDVRVV